jgi:hypothetical protein
LMGESIPMDPDHYLRSAPNTDIRRQEHILASATTSICSITDSSSILTCSNVPNPSASISLNTARSSR